MSRDETLEWLRSRSIAKCIRTPGGLVGLGDRQRRQMAEARDGLLGTPLPPAVARDVLRHRLAGFDLRSLTTSTETAP